MAHYNPVRLTGGRKVKIPDFAYLKKSELIDEEEEKYVSIANWERAYLSTIIKEGEDISDYVKVTSFKEYDSDKSSKLWYSVNNRHNWFTGQVAYAPKYINEEAYKRLTELSGGISPTINIHNDVCVDENGYYWVAAGPNVVSPHFRDGGTPLPADMYGKGYLDAVIEDSLSNSYYIHCRIGGTKAHTWNNGVIQTWYKYPNAELKTYVSDEYQNEYNGAVCIEFFSLPDLANKLNYGDESMQSTLGQYEISELLFFEEPNI